MNCPLCGEVCRCHSEPIPGSLSQWTLDAESGPESFDGMGMKGMDREVAGAPAVEGSDLKAEPDTETGDAHAWRDELSDRLNRYRARRKVRPPRYPSLSLRFEAFESPTNANPASGSYRFLHLNRSQTMPSRSTE